MILLKCAFTDDEMLTDAYPREVVDDIVYSVKGKWVVEGGDDFGIESDEQLESSEQKVINIVAAHKLVEMQYTKKQFTTFLKGFLKRVNEHLKETKPERAAVFQKASAAYCKKVLKEFSEYQFYIGETTFSEGRTDGSVVLCRYDGAEPTFFFFFDALIEEKY